MAAVIVLTTVNNSHKAQDLARAFVDRNLAACVNIVDRVHSIYRWKGNVESAEEVLLLIKTTAERVDELKAALFDLHPYEVPEFVVLAIDHIGEPYATWLRDQVTIER